MLLVQCLQGGSFRTQSAVLEFLANSIGQALSVSDEHTGTLEGQLYPRIPEALQLLVMDEGMPVLSAALALCREQPKAQGDDDSTAPETAWEASEKGDWVKASAPTSKGAVSGASAAWGSGGGDAFVQQKCCEDPTDCEEPAVSACGSSARTATSFLAVPRAP